MTPFRNAVLQIVEIIPLGKVTSYGDVAAMAGQPRAARDARAGLVLAQYRPRKVGRGHPQ